LLQRQVMHVQLLAASVEMHVQLLAVSLDACHVQWLLLSPARATAALMHTDPSSCSCRRHHKQLLSGHGVQVRPSWLEARAGLRRAARWGAGLHT
jgi:hypothetical protein